MRLSHHDHYAQAHFLPRLIDLASSLDSASREMVAATAERVWESFFPLGESLDLAYGIGCLLYELGEYRRALGYFGYSANAYGGAATTLHNMALCHCLLGEDDEAAALLQGVEPFPRDPVRSDVARRR